MDEYLDIVDINDRVIGKATREEIYKHKHLHRIVHILVFNPIGEMALQKRSQAKFFAPGHWSTAVGGHVQAGESYDQAAEREIQEELGITALFTFLSKDYYTDPELGKFITSYTAVHDGTFTVDPEEADYCDHFSLDTIKSKILDGEKFHPELLFLLNRHYFAPKT